MEVGMGGRVVREGNQRSVRGVLLWAFMGLSSYVDISKNT